MIHRLQPCALVLVWIMGPIGTAVAQDPIFQNPFRREKENQLPLGEKLGKIAREKETELSKKYPKLLMLEPIEHVGDMDEMRRLLVARRNASVDEMNGIFAEYRSGRSSMRVVGRAASRLLESNLAVEDDVAEQITLLEQFVALMKEFELFAEKSLQHGTGTLQESAHARYLRLDGEIKLLSKRRELAGSSDEQNSPSKP